ncbi:unnamed protein product [Rotaria magnacalcarata]|uniref:PWWP domain-containing protein n=3 Tax=Rotaria magnacalcarata TaxID=392030 RepID=A0A816SG80_9BILA|nr:unnamed protein product [Rotaria magnacalcarata]
MTSNSLSTFPDGFNIGDITWAKRNQDGMYWPGRITFISNNATDTVSTQISLQDQMWSYFIEYFGCNQSNWTTDVLPYRQYRDYMSKHLSSHYDAHPQIKYQLLNAINQADYANMNGNFHSMKSDNSSSSYSYTTNQNYIPTSNSIDTTNDNPVSYNYSLNSYYQYPSNSLCNTQVHHNNCCSYCTQSKFSTTNQLPIETSLNSVSQVNNECSQFHSDAMSSQIDRFQKENSIVIITSKIYSNSSFISHLFNCLSNVFQPSIIYIEDIIHYQHPHTHNITYLISFDYFNSIIQQTLNSTILNNLNAHINYLFLIINSPSYDLIQHFYSTITDTRSILILQYHTAFDNEPLLLCSGNRLTFDKIQSSFLTYLCTKIKYMESDETQPEQCDSSNGISSRSQSNYFKNISMIEFPNQTVNSSSWQQHESFKNEYFSLSPIVKRKKILGQRSVFDNFRKKLFKRRLKQNQILSSASSESCIQNILQSLDSSTESIT